MKKLLKLFRQWRCQHRFDYKDLVGRTTPDGDVKWTCWKCKKVFVAPCGLDILSHGKVELEVTAGRSLTKADRLYEAHLQRLSDWMKRQRK